jgi:hypothetical protein
VVVELLQVLGRGDEAPRPHGGSSASWSLPESAVVLGVPEHRLDCLLSLAVELMAVHAGDDATHEVIESARPSGARVVFETEFGGTSTLGAKRRRAGDDGPDVRAHPRGGARGGRRETGVLQPEAIPLGSSEGWPRLTEP